MWPSHTPDDGELIDPSGILYHSHWWRLLAGIKRVSNLKTKKTTNNLTSRLHHLQHFHCNFRWKNMTTSQCTLKCSCSYCVQRIMTLHNFRDNKTRERQMSCLTHQFWSRPYFPTIHRAIIESWEEIWVSKVKWLMTCAGNARRRRATSCNRMNSTPVGRDDRHRQSKAHDGTLLFYYLFFFFTTLARL